MPITSKISTKAEVFLPQAVREYLGVRPGDEVEYELRDGCVTVRPVRKAAASSEDPFVYFTEWASDADETAYGDL